MKKSPASSLQRSWRVRDYDLIATLDCGQAFNWRQHGNVWHGVVGDQWVELELCSDELTARTVQQHSDWSWLEEYLQIHVKLDEVFAAFPPDDVELRRAVAACRGMRLLKQDRWECLASFILSSTKQIVQIKQITGLLRKRSGKPVKVPDGCEEAFAFPCAETIAQLTELELRECKMGFRAAYLLDAARKVADGELDLKRIESIPLLEAKVELMQIHGVGEKIAECVLLYGYGFPTAFPVDVWVARALSEFYFRGRKIALPKLRRFAEKHFGSQAGYAQQYLFHHIRTRGSTERKSKG